MGFGSIWHWLIVLLIVLVLFGRGRVADIMGDFGKGIKRFKQGMADETKDSASASTPPQIPAAKEAPAPESETSKTDKS